MIIYYFHTEGLPNAKLLLIVKDPIGKTLTFFLLLLNHFLTKIREPWRGFYDLVRLITLILDRLVSDFVHFKLDQMTEINAFLKGELSPRVLSRFKFRPGKILFHLLISIIY